ncbi:MAG: VOC family protein [Sphingomonadaceae bacterium]
MTTPAPFCWYELLTNDKSGATDFYTHVVGWAAKPTEGSPEGVDYTLLEADDVPAAGIMALNDEACTAGARPGWLGYVLVDDVDAAAEQAKSLGGSIYMEPADIPEVGRFAVIGDPHGAAIGLLKWAQPMPEMPAMPMKIGRTGWHELMAGELESDFAFYESLFGWVGIEDLDMGAMGTYRLFGLAKEASIGGMMNKPDQMPMPNWGYYFTVDDIDAAITRVTERNGQVINGPMEVPGGAWIIQGLDPEGVYFALVAPPKGS